MHTKARAFIMILALGNLGLGICPGCTSGHAPPAAPPRTVEAWLAEEKLRVMAADYRADLAELARLREVFAPLASDPEWGYLALYWAGFASWRQAINGANQRMPVDELKRHLERASADFAASLEAREDFADSHAAAALVEGWRIGFYGDDQARMREVIDRHRRHLERAKELDADNARVLWAAASPLMFLPPDRGGDPDRALATYERMAQVAQDPNPRSPLPDWGRAEAHMSLAYAYWRRPQSDFVAAEREARAALALVPEWAYVRDNLLPAIVQARSEERGE